MLENNYSFNGLKERHHDLGNFYQFLEGFSKEELLRIEKDVESLELEMGKTGDGENSNEDGGNVRNSRVKWIPQNDDWKWLYEKLGGMILEANRELWNFNLYNMPEQIQYTEYDASYNGKYEWHMDVGAGDNARRKVSVTVQLSDEHEYEGGDLEFFTGGEMNEREFKKGQKRAGTVYIFPSYMLHRVAPVTKGLRKSFVLWVGGTPYK
tara:strand:- start:201 stop:827 length:627 start_codon:yes stop_codon:yes gene_type:complete